MSRYSSPDHDRGLARVGRLLLPSIAPIFGYPKNLDFFMQNLLSKSGEKIPLPISIDFREDYPGCCHALNVLLEVLASIIVD
jgi:hypothetical protein